MNPIQALKAIRREGERLQKRLLKRDYQEHDIAFAAGVMAGIAEKCLEQNAKDVAAKDVAAKPKPNRALARDVEKLREQLEAVNARMKCVCSFRASVENVLRHFPARKGKR